MKKLVSLLIALAVVTVLLAVPVAAAAESYDFSAPSVTICPNCGTYDAHFGQIVGETAHAYYCIYHCTMCGEDFLIPIYIN